MFQISVKGETLGNGSTVWVTSEGFGENPGVNRSVFLKSDDPLITVLREIANAVVARDDLAAENRSKDAEISAYTAKISDLRAELRKLQSETGKISDLRDELNRLKGK
ncbi:hypothetical protein SEA_BECKERTON_51 [Mycobacterium phage Beckerton]|uniref:Uncharacterized protein n=1 Tax=Mycobacterium phage Konstantine TaxID=563121 RepID=B5U525_9CAUD|nr:gp55 [Mycobacterium phage Konstantine]ACI12471.1 hypothetical protein KONSTANTINE_55 [Mycobacterium phage Konstantine]AXH47177.1 hypothetical protein SEA_CBORCH11_53 [Mycobacterium phage Cborch11]QLF83936.1 hypothetical protein SEA_BECKERTON_51 [Mycobacterium phage Beckerton]